MFKKIIKFLPIFIFAVFVASGVFSVVLAQSQINLNSPLGEAKTPAQFIENFYRYALGIVGAAAFVVIIYGAILYTTSAGNPAKQQDARAWITGAIWGIVLLLSTYLILYTINPNLVNLVDPHLEKIDVNSLQVKSSSGFGLSDGAARAQLRQQSIGTKDICSIGQTDGCVSLEGINQETLNEIFSVAGKVGSSNVFVTGGTEGGHEGGNFSHGTGYKFDLRPNDTLDSYIRDKYEKEKDKDNKYKSPSGAVYTFEEEISTITYVGSMPIKDITRYAHWDVLVQPSEIKIISS